MSDELRAMSRKPGRLLIAQRSLLIDHCYYALVDAEASGLGGSGGAARS